MLVIWGESGWSELSNRYSMQAVFWEFLIAVSIHGDGIYKESFTSYRNQ
jgi:hypothetical protein